MSMLDDRLTVRPPGDAEATDTVVLHRRRGALGLVGAGSLAVAVAYTWRVATGGDVLGLALAVAMLPIAVVHLAGWWDARTPLLVADRTGLRVRDGAVWTGLRWDQVEAVRVRPATRPGRDARLEVSGHDPDGPSPTLSLALVDPAEVRDLSGALTSLSEAPDGTVTRNWRKPAPDEAPEQQDSASSRVGEAAPGGLRALLRRSRTEHTATVARADVVHRDDDAGEEPSDQERTERTLRDHAPGRVGLVLEERHAGAEPEARTVIDAEPFVPVSHAPADPVIGPELVAARTRLRLGVDDLAERTRIRPHVIEAIEVDDFSACGGDVYARGHLRSLARALGVEPQPLLAAYEQRYASGPVTARSVFEAELAGPARSLRRAGGGGPRWSVLIGVVLVLVLVWGLARLLVPAPAADDGRPGAHHGARADAGDRDGSGATGVTRADRFAAMGEPRHLVRMSFSSAPDATTATPVRVVDRDGEVVYQGPVSPEQTRQVAASGPVTVTTPDGGAVVAKVNGRDRGPLGAAGERVQRTLGR